MKLIRRLTWQNMKSCKARTIVTILGIILSAAMFTAVTTMGVSFRAFMMEAEIAERGDFFVQLDYGSMEQLEALRKDKAVTELGTLNTIGYADLKDNAAIIGAGDSRFFEMCPVHLEEGRLPETGSELVIPDLLREQLHWNLGDSVSLNLETACENDLELPSSGEPFEKTFTIVGIMENGSNLYDYALSMEPMLTFDDDSADGIWGRFFVKTNLHAVFDFETRIPNYAPVSTIHYSLLEFYGVSKYSTINDLIAGFAATLMAIIMVGSVSLIYNAFSISVSERTKQFGLLSSVGATRRQIRRCVFTEALYLSAVGIPLGLLSGYVGIAVTLHLTHGLIDNMLWTARENEIILRAVPSMPAFAAAALVALVTVLISAWVPARRATKITPIAAIRQNKDYQVPKRGIRAGKLSKRLFGLPAALARKYYTVNKRKYRATIISLTISMVLFVAAGAFSQALNATAQEEANLENFDFIVYPENEQQLEAVRANPAVREAVMRQTATLTTYLPTEAFTEDYQTAWELVTGADSRRPMNNQYVDFQYLEDESLRSFLAAQGIDPSPYFDPAHPLALLTQAELDYYALDENGRTTDRQRFVQPVLKESVTELPLLPNYFPDGVLMRFEDVRDLGLKQEDGILIQHILICREAEDGSLIETPAEIELHTDTDARTVSYYLRDPETGIPETEPLDMVAMEQMSLSIGATIRELPFGVSRNHGSEAITVILPLSAAPHSDSMANLVVVADDYEAFAGFLEQEEISHLDYLAGQLQYRDYLTMIRIFSYGFIALISLICICNVFNTISTNIALRRKDFGMLCSIGMKNREILRMVAFECLQYGVMAMLWGIPLSTLISLVINSSLGIHSLETPVQAMAIASGCIFLTVFITMFYAVSKVRKQNPIEAIRTES